MAKINFDIRKSIEKELRKGKTYREISTLTGLSKNTIGYDYSTDNARKGMTRRVMPREARVWLFFTCDLQGYFTTSSSQKNVHLQIKKACYIFLHVRYLTYDY